jgi:electron transport complex protein RnfG
MISFDKTQQKMALALFVVGLLAASMLALVDQVTQEPIAAAQREALHKGLVQVLPEHQNDPLQDAFIYKLSDAEKLQVFPARDKLGRVIGYAWEQIAPDGYSGTIRILMGIRVAGEIVAIRITEHKETPGLGDGITSNSAWLNSFVRKTLNTSTWKVKKDGGDFDQFTGATITPRAVVKAVHNGLTMYKKSRRGFYKAYKVNQKKKEDKQLADQKSGGSS